MCLFLASRLALFGVGLLSTWLLPSAHSLQQPRNLVWHETAPRALEIWARWDSEWYLLIAAKGYDVGGLITGSGVPYKPTAASGFLPLYPVLIRGLTPLLGAVGAGVLISNFCLLVSLFLLHRLVRMEVDTESSESAALVACAALLLFPSSLFLSAVYAESLFLALSLGAFILSRQGRFAAAGALAGLATLTRPFGILLVIPIVWEWWSRWRRREDIGGQTVSLWGWLGAMIPPAALLSYMLYCRSIFGDPLAFVHRQQRWRGSLSGPWRAFIRWWEAGPVAHGSHDSTLELLVAVVCVVMFGFMVRKMRPSYTLYTAAGLLVTLGSTLWSFSRLALSLFPFFIFIGLSWSDGRRCLPVMYAFFGATLSGLLMALFANWWWVG